MNIKTVFGQTAKLLIFYFPSRLLICCLFFSLVLLNNIQSLLTIEKQFLAGLLQFFQIHAYYLDGSLYVTNFYSSYEIVPPIHTQILFLSFFLSLAVATFSSSMRLRLTILSFGVLCLLFSIAMQVFTIGMLETFNSFSIDAFLKVSTILVTIGSALIFEFALFSTLTLPRRIKVKPVIKRSFTKEIQNLSVLIFISFIIIYILVTIIQISTDSPLTTYVSLSVVSVFWYTESIAYFIWDVIAPSWIKFSGRGYTPSVSFLMAAYNESALIRRCIEGIDRAASKYKGKTEIIIVNDGSEDNTLEVISNAFNHLKNSTGKVFTIPNSGKGTALNYGLKHVFGEIIFRVDSDSIIDENAMAPILRHFRDPEVGSVGGVILPLEEKTVWQKLTLVIYIIVYSFRRSQELVDSMVIQSGAFSVFRKVALLRAGGWAENQNGEDGEITVRLGRLGYKVQFETNSLLLTDIPGDLAGVRNQQIRWAIGYYHSHSRNLGIIRDFNSPRSLYYVFTVLLHGIQFLLVMLWPFLLASIITGTINQTSSTSYNITGGNGVTDLIVTYVVTVGVVEIFTFGLHYCMIMLFLVKFKKLRSHLKYLPLFRIWVLLIMIFFRLEAVEILLTWSSKWKVHNKESYVQLKKYLRRQLKMLEI